MHSVDIWIIFSTQKKLAVISFFQTVQLIMSSTMTASTIDIDLSACSQKEKHHADTSRERTWLIGVMAFLNLIVGVLWYNCDCKASRPRVEYPGFESHLHQNFSGLSHTSDLINNRHPSGYSARHQAL